MSGQVLREIPPNSVTYEVVSYYTTIYGLSEQNYAFSSSKDTLKSFTFAANPQLQTIQQYAFYNCKKLQSIDLTICTKLTSIGSYAFNGCSSVQTLSLPSCILSLGSYCFQYCSSLTKIILPASLQEIGRAIFAYCSVLKELIFEDFIGITVIPYWMIRGTKITNITIPANVSEVTSGAFEYAFNIQNIFVAPGNAYFNSDNGVLYNNDFTTLLTYPAKHSSSYTTKSNCKTIDNIAFSGSNLAEITLNDGLLSINSTAFQLTKIKSIIIPDSVNFLGTWIFNYCSNLNNITLSRQITSLPDSTFANCGFIQFNVPSTVTSIGPSCFQNNQKLELIILPANLQSLGGGAFSGCPKTLVIQFPDDSKYSISNNIFIVDKAKQTIYQYLGYDETTITIPQTIKTISSSAFLEKSNIIHVKLESGSNLKTIGDNAFKNCKQLESIALDTVETINFRAFTGCESLISVSFGSSLSLLSNQTFEDCLSLCSVTFQSTTNLKINSLCFNGCTNLSTVKFAEGLTLIGYDAFKGATKLTYVEFPSSLVTIENNCFEGSGLKTVKFHQCCNLKVLPPYLFNKCTSLNNLTLPPSITNISIMCFAETALSSFIVPLRTLTIGDMAFSSCTKLTSFSIPSKCDLEEIGYKLFAGCSKLSNITSDIENFVVENEALFTKNRDVLLAFPPASKIKFFAFPQNVRTVNPGGFVDATSLEIILVPDDSLVKIDFNAFEGCKNLHTINIPSSVKEIGSDAFIGCTKLRCGLSIEETDPSKLNEWITKARLPSRSVRPCYVPTCNQIFQEIKSKIPNFVIIYLFL